MTGLPTLAPAQRRVARFFGEHADRLGFYSAADIAGRLGTSDATVVRTAQALGFHGLTDLKRALLSDAGDAAEPTPSGRLHATLRHGSAPVEVLDHVLDVHEAALDVARTRLREPFPTAVALLARAERIVISGTGPTAGVARYMTVLLGRIGRPAATITGTGVSMADEALGLRRGDALVLLAHTPLHHHAAVLIDVARLRRAPVLLVTDTATDVAGVDLMLTCPRGLPGQTSSHAVTVLLLEALVVALAATDRHRAATALSELNRLRGHLLATPAEVDTSEVPPAAQ